MAGYFHWQSPLQWFGVALGSSLWVAISSGVLLAKGQQVVGGVFAGVFVLLAALALLLWSRRERLSCCAAWQAWFAALGIGSLLALATAHATKTNSLINLSDGGLLFMYAGIVLGVPLLILDFRARQESNGAQGGFGAIFDAIASFF